MSGLFSTSDGSASGELGTGFELLEADSDVLAFRRDDQEVLSTSASRNVHSGPERWSWRLMPAMSSRPGRR
jgi:hypothetical protein